MNIQNKKTYLSILLSALLLQGCGGGGGGGGSSNPTVPDTNTDPVTVVPDTNTDPVTPAPVAEPNPVLSYGGTTPTTYTDFTHSYVENYSHQQKLNMKQAWDLGYTGQGVKIAVIDSGINTTHNEFNQIVSAESSGITRAFVLDPATDWKDGDYTITETPTYEDDIGHGSHVASLAAGSTTGIAPDAEIVSTKSFFLETEVSSGDIVEWGDSGINLSAISKTADIAGVDFMNASFTGLDVAYTMDERNYLSSALGRNDVGLIVAVGNFSQNMTTALTNVQTGGTPDATLFIDDAENFSKMLYVGALNKSGILANFSNYPGENTSLQSRTLTTYGTFMEGADYTNDTGMVYMTGTSMAAPIVTGAAAVIKSRWTSLSNAQILQILLDTADKDFVEYSAHYYGQGRLDVISALNPVGALTTSTSSTGYSTNNGYVRASNSLANKLSKSSALQNVAFFDTYDRNYNMDVTKRVVASDEYSKISFDFIDSPQTDDNIAFRSNLNSQQYSQGINLGGLKIEQANYIKTGTSQTAKEASNLLTNYNVDFYKNYENLQANSLQLNLNGSKLTIESADFGTDLNNRNSMLKATISKKIGNNNIFIGYEKNNQNNALYSLAGSGFLSISESAEFNILSFGGDMKLSNDFTLFGNMSYGGVESMNTNPNSLIESVSDVQVSGASIGGIFNLNKNSKLGFVMYKPVDVVSANINVKSATSLSSNGSINYAKETVKLSEDTRPNNLEMSFKTTTKDNTSFKFSLVGKNINSISQNTGIGFSIHKTLN